MFKLITYAAIFYVGYKWGSMTPEERQNFLQGAKTRLSNVEKVVTDEFGNKLNVIDNQS